MKKTMALVLFFVICVSLCSCGKKTAKIGETYTTEEGVEITVKSITWANKIEKKKIEKNLTSDYSSYTYEVKNENYCLPLSADADEDQADNAQAAPNIFCSVIYTAKNVSKNDLKIKKEQLMGMLNYDDGYTYGYENLDYYYRDIVYFCDSDIWEEIDFELEMEQLKEDVYEIRLFMYVPRELAENTHKPLTYTVHGLTYDLRENI